MKIESEDALVSVLQRFFRDGKMKEHKRNKKRTEFNNIVFLAQVPLVIDIEADMTVAWSGLRVSQTLKQQIYLNDTLEPKVVPKPPR